MYDKEGVRRYQATAKGRAARLLASSRAKSRQNNLDNDLDAAWIIERINNGCAQTGVAFNLHHKGGQGFHRVADNAPSLDRIDPTRGYTKDNVQVVTWIYNRAKLQSTDAAVLDFARALVRAHGG
jgi:hypothetical protein